MPFHNSNARQKFQKNVTTTFITNFFSIFECTLFFPLQFLLSSGISLALIGLQRCSGGHLKEARWKLGHIYSNRTGKSWNGKQIDNEEGPLNLGHQIFVLFYLEMVDRVSQISRRTNTTKYWMSMQDTKDPSKSKKKTTMINVMIKALVSNARNGTWLVPRGPSTNQRGPQILPSFLLLRRWTQFCDSFWVLTLLNWASLAYQSVWIFINLPACTLVLWVFGSI